MSVITGWRRYSNERHEEPRSRTVLKFEFNELMQAMKAWQA